MNHPSAQIVPDMPLPPALYPILAIIGGYLLQRYLPLTWPQHLLYKTGAWLVFLVGIALLSSAIYCLRKHRTTLLPHLPSDNLVQTGPYRLSRNPIYLAFLLFVVASALATLNVWMLLLTAAAAGCLQRYAIKPEEACLRLIFGTRYSQYLTTVRRWL